MPPRIDFLHINTARTWRGGEQQTFNLIAGLHNCGVLVGLVCPPNAPLAEKATSCGIPVFEIAIKSEADFRAALKIRNICKQYGVGLTHAHTAHAHTVAYWATLGTDIKRLVSRRVDFSIYRHDCMKINWLKYRYMAHHYVAISKYIKGVLVKDGLNSDSISVVHSGVDPLRFAAIADAEVNNLKQEFNVGPSTKVIINSAQLSWEKGQYALIAAMPAFLQKYPDTKLFLLGGGEQDTLRRLITELGLAEQVVLPGFRKDIGVFYKMCDLFVMPSVYEGLGTSVLDALALKKPVVAANGGGLPEMIKDGITGRLVYMRDPENLGKELKHDPRPDGQFVAPFAADISRTLLQAFDNYAESEAMTTAGYDILMREFTFDSMVAGNLAVYRELVPKLFTET